jgi:uncharacterized membrane protein YcaP (DUF421 family)
MTILGIDLGQVFLPDENLFEIVLRGLLMYFGIIVLLRVLLKGRTGGTSLPDLLVLVLIADAAQNAISAAYHSWTAGFVLVLTIVGASSALDFLAHRFPTVGRIVNPDKKPLIINGRVIRKNLDDEWITEEELLAQLRMSGVEDPGKVKAAYLEHTGDISVIPFENGNDKAGPRAVRNAGGVLG